MATRPIFLPLEAARRLDLTQTGSMVLSRTLTARPPYPRARPPLATSITASRRAHNRLAS